MGKFVPSFSLELRATDIKAVTQAVEGMSKRMLDANAAGVDAMAKVVLEEVKKVTPVRSGVLRDSLGLMNRKKTGTVAEVRVGARPGYGRTKRGDRPQDILAYLQHGNKRQTPNPILTRGLRNAQSKALAAYDAKVFATLVKGEVSNA